MVADTNNPAEATVEAVKANIDAVEAVAKAATPKGTARKTGRKAAAKTARKATAKTTGRKAAAKTTARKATAKTTGRKTAARATAQPARNMRNDAMNFQSNKAFAGFNAFPAAEGFQSLFNDTAGRTEEVAKRSRKAAEQFADMARGNVDAVVEASRIAATGAQSIGQSVIAKSRDNLELAADTVRSMTEVKNPADLLQLQANFWRGSFDRFVEESASLTESMVKLAGESFQPISNRTSANVERINDLVA